ncbi:aquaporin-11 [Aplysia californica]|uniref:Aquaporin-11 n=1 Tax=Aplysia californica TaxID=6500 RepID=A0ABM0JCF0_APLCA|nr:aquaporin-11 [Aplysia californica]
MAGIDWRSVYTLTTGADPEVEFVEPYVASLLFFAINMTTGLVLRTLTSIFVPQPLRGLVLDFLATMEACAYFFENNFVMKYYGSFWFALAIVVQFFVCARTFGGASENPVKALQSLVAGDATLLAAVAQIAVQTLAGLASYRFARLVWSLDLISDHHERYYETMCSSDLQVTFLMGFLIELSACLTDTWLGMQTIATIPILDELIKYVNAALMVVLGLATTGMYFNPAMASGHTLGCQGTAMSEHFFVYWAGPFVGCFVALRLDKLLHVDVTTQKTVDADKKTN